MLTDKQKRLIYVFGAIVVLGFFWLFGMRAAQAQEPPQLIFNLNTSSGIESVIPEATWSTSPSADSCVASGDWSGEKGASGNEMLPEIFSSANYALTCTWQGQESVTLTWTAPTQNTDGTPLTTLTGYALYRGTQSGEYPDRIPVPDASATSYVDGPLPAGTYYYVATAVTEGDIESDYSNEAMKVLEGAGDTATVARQISINPKPNPPAGLGAN